MSKFTIPDNGLTGLLRGATITIGERDFDIKVLNLESSRKVWVFLQRWLAGAAAAAEVNSELAEAGETVRMDILSVVGQMGALGEREFDEVVKAFAATTSFRGRVPMPDGTTREDMRFLKEAGALDVAFGGAFEEMLEWLSACIYLNFGRQLEKHSAAVATHNRLAAAKAKPTPAA
jgi:hypothetical protein